MKIYHTKTQEDYDVLMREFESIGCVWVGEQKPTIVNIWGVCKEDTCVICDKKMLSYGSKFWKDNTYPNILTIEYAAKKPRDNVHNPSHYTQGERETIENIRDAMSSEGYQGYCVGNVIKYLARYKFKNGLEDVRKAKKYIGFLEEELIKQEGN